MNTPLYKIDSDKNEIYIKRDDLYPYSFGGNKARKGNLFFKDIVRKNSDCVVTYGSSSSNHVRIIANKCCELKLPCYIISPSENSKKTFNSMMYSLFGAKVIKTSIEKVAETIDITLDKLKSKGYKPYFIQGGGHGNLGTQAYVDCYKEILDYENKNNIKFDYIFHASGTGTTQAGLICGKLLNKDKKEIVGISIARNNPRGRDIVCQSVKDYLLEKKIEFTDKKIDKEVVFIDEYIVSGYASYNKEIVDCIKKSMKNFGISMDTTYVGKAYNGMNKYIKEKDIENKNILFIHTGGAPLFFDDLEELNG